MRFVDLFTSIKMAPTPSGSKKVTKIVNRCYSRMRTAFRLSTILLNAEKYSDELFTDPEFDKIVCACLKLIGMPATANLEIRFDRAALIKFIDLWCTDERIAVAKAGSGEHFLREFHKLLQTTAVAMEGVDEFEQMVVDEVDKLQQKLKRMETANRKEISNLIKKSSEEVKQMPKVAGAKEARLTLVVEELTRWLKDCEIRYENELKHNATEINELSKLLRAAVDDYDRQLSPVYEEYSQLNDELEKQQQIIDHLKKVFAEQDAEYQRVVAKEEQIYIAKLRAFRVNRAAKIIQRAFRDFRVKKRKRLRIKKKPPKNKEK